MKSIFFIVINSNGLNKFISINASFFNLESFYLAVNLWVFHKSLVLSQALYKVKSVKNLNKDFLILVDFFLNKVKV